MPVQAVVGGGEVTDFEQFCEDHNITQIPLHDIAVDRCWCKPVWRWLDGRWVLMHDIPEVEWT